MILSADVTTVRLGLIGARRRALHVNALNQQLCDARLLG
jgi:hypothetical protein